MRRQRFTHTLSRVSINSNFEDPEESSSYDVNNSYTQNSLSPEQVNWMPHNISNDSLVRNQRSQSNHRSFLSEPNICNNLMFTDIYSGQNNLNQSNSNLFCDTLGNSPNGFPHCLNDLRRLSIDSYPYYRPQDLGCGTADNYILYDSSSHNMPYIQQDWTTNISLSPYGTVFVVLRNMVRIDITPEKGVYVTNHPARCVGVLSPTLDQSCIIHPNGKILEEFSGINVESKGKAAKICEKGVVFTSAFSALAYLVDASGTKTTSEKFQKWSHEYTFKLFYGNDFENTCQLRNECIPLMNEATHRMYGNGDEIWLIGGVRIKQDAYGEIRVIANGGRRILRTSPTVQFMSISTPSAFMLVDCDLNMHVRVEKNGKSIVAGQNSLTVKNGSQKAGLNRFNRLVLH